MFCLVHGAWHGGWCWAPLTRELEARGHEVVAPDLPTDDPAAGLHDFAGAVGAQPGAIVVGHSYGGLILPLIEARLHVYLCALVPTPGRPTAEVFGDALDPDFGGTTRDALGRTYWPSLDIAADRLYGDYPRHVVEWAFPLLRPQAQNAVGGVYPLSELPPIPAAYVLARGDRAVLPDWSADTAQQRLGVEPLAVGGGHFPMFDRPGELADLLEGLLEQLA